MNTPITLLEARFKTRHLAEGDYYATGVEEVGRRGRENAMNARVHRVGAKSRVLGDVIAK